MPFFTPSIGYVAFERERRKVEGRIPAAGGALAGAVAHDVIRPPNSTAHKITGTWFTAEAPLRGRVAGDVDSTLFADGAGLLDVIIS